MIKYLTATQTMSTLTLFIIVGILEVVLLNTEDKDWFSIIFVSF